MKQLIVLVSLILLFTHDLYSQEDFESGSSLRVEVSPLTMIYYTPRFRFGFEFLSNNKLGYSINFGIGNSSLNKARLDGLIFGNDYSFFEIRPEIKYVLIKNEDNSFYCATELFYIKMRDQFKSGHYQKKDSYNEIVYDSAIFNKQKTGVHFKAGIGINIFKRLDFDLYGGVGIAERKIDYSDIVNPIEGERPIFVEWIPQPDLFEGKSVIFQLTMGYKIVYTLWSKQ